MVEFIGNGEGGQDSDTKRIDRTRSLLNFPHFPVDKCGQFAHIGGIFLPLMLYTCPNISTCTLSMITPIIDCTRA